MAVRVIAYAVGRFLQQGNTVSFSNYIVSTAIGEGGMNLSAWSIFDGGKKLCSIILEAHMTGLTRSQFGLIQMELCLILHMIS